MTRIAGYFNPAARLWDIRANSASPWGQRTPRFDYRMTRFRAAYLQPGLENA